MLQYKGFLKADVDDSFKDNRIITVKYFIKNKDNLNFYIGPGVELIVLNSNGKDVGSGPGTYSYYQEE